MRCIVVKDTVTLAATQSHFNAHRQTVRHGGALTTVKFSLRLCTIVVGGKRTKPSWATVVKGNPGLHTSLRQSVTVGEKFSSVSARCRWTSGGHDKFIYRHILFAFSFTDGGGTPMLYFLLIYLSIMIYQRPGPAPNYDHNFHLFSHYNAVVITVFELSVSGKCFRVMWLYILSCRL